MGVEYPLEHPPLGISCRTFYVSDVSDYASIE